MKIGSGLKAQGSGLESPALSPERFVATTSWPRIVRECAPMPHSLAELARALVGSPPNRLALYLLGNVPGFPPMVQTVHLLSIAAIMGSIVLINLRLLGLAL